MPSCLPHALVVSAASLSGVLLFIPLPSTPPLLSSSPLALTTPLDCIWLFEHFYLPGQLPIHHPPVVTGCFLAPVSELLRCLIHSTRRTIAAHSDPEPPFSPPRHPRCLYMTDSTLPSTIDCLLPTVLSTSPLALVTAISVNTAPADRAP